MLLLEHEATARRQKRFETRARAARLRHPASVEDVDYRSHRGLDRALFLKLATGDWIRTRRNLVITGPCVVGKSWLACALGHKSCRDDLSVLYYPDYSVEFRRAVHIPGARLEWRTDEEHRRCPMQTIVVPYRCMDDGSTSEPTSEPSAGLRRCRSDRQRPAAGLHSLAGRRSGETRPESVR